MTLRPLESHFDLWGPSVVNLQWLGWRSYLVTVPRDSLASTTRNHDSQSLLWQWNWAISHLHLTELTVIRGPAVSSPQLVSVFSSESSSPLSLLYEKAEDVRFIKGCVSRGEKPQSPSQYAVTARDDPLLEMTSFGVHILLFASTRAVSLWACEPVIFVSWVKDACWFWVSNLRDAQGG